MNRFSLLVAGILAGFACGDTTTSPINQLNLDRPVDVAFACYGGMRITNGDPANKDQPVTITAMPTSACDIRSAARDAAAPTPVPEGQEDLTADGGFPISGAAWYALILQSGPGTIALAKFPTLPARSFQGIEVSMIDGDPLTPTKNTISVGEEPIAIVTDTTGCAAVTANAGSCDLSVVDVNSLALTPPKAVVNRLAVTNAAGVAIRARPTAMVAEPSSKAIGNQCSVNDASDAKASGLIYVAYPGCHLVAGIDASTGTIVTGIKFDAAGVPTIVDGNVTCDDECAGVIPSPGTRPISIDLELDARVASRRMVIGAANSPAITIVELDDMTRPTTLSQITLASVDPTKPIGINKVVLSPQIGMGGGLGTINDDGAPGGQSQFVYAIASDHTVRVADILTLNKECDTQVDPRLLRSFNSIKDLSCLPVGAATTPARRQGARGPGIELPGDAVPTSLDIIRSEEIPQDIRSQDPGRLVGYFAIVSATNGANFVINIDDDDFPDLFKESDPLKVPIPKAIPHHLRDGIANREKLAEFEDKTTEPATVKPLCLVQNPVDESGAVQFGPRATTTPARLGTAGNLADTKITQLPGFLQLKCVAEDAKDGIAISELSFSALPAQRYEVFPDLAALNFDETWTVTYEGALSVDSAQSAIDGPAIRESQMKVDSAGLHMLDKTQPFCDAGVEQFDVVQMRGCDPTQGNIQCPNGYRCFVHPESQIAGLGTCLLEDEADRLASACKEYLTSIRRYTVQKSTANELTLVPRRHELRTSPIDGCVDDNQCQVLADYARTLTSPDHPALDMTTVPEARLYQCVADSTRPAVATGKRCELRCDTSADCLGGTVCQGAGAAGSKTGFCMEGVTPPQACVNAPQRYEMRAGYAFTVVGTVTGYLHGTKVNPVDKTCIKDTTAHRLQVGRIPLAAPPCDPAADPITGKKPDGTFEPNPCSTTVANTDIQPNYVPGSVCVLDTEKPTTLVERQAAAIRFRNRAMNLTLVDPTYPGDSKTGCILDRGGGLTNIPTVFPNYQLSFRQNAGFAPLALPISPAFPVKVIRGPTNSIWIVDEGDFISTSVGLASTRGKVFRVEPHAFAIVNRME